MLSYNNNNNTNNKNTNNNNTNSYNNNNTNNTNNKNKNNNTKIVSLINITKHEQPTILTQHQLHNEKENRKHTLSSN